MISMPRILLLSEWRPLQRQYLSHRENNLSSYLLVYMLIHTIDVGNRSTSKGLESQIMTVAEHREGIRHARCANSDLKPLRDG